MALSKFFQNLAAPAPLGKPYPYEDTDDEEEINNFYAPPPPPDPTMNVLESRGSSGAYGLENAPGAGTQLPGAEMPRLEQRGQSGPSGLWTPERIPASAAGQAYGESMPTVDQGPSMYGPQAQGRATAAQLQFNSPDGQLAVIREKMGKLPEGIRNGLEVVWTEGEGYKVQGKPRQDLPFGATEFMQQNVTPRIQGAITKGLETFQGAVSPLLPDVTLDYNMGREQRQGRAPLLSPEQAGNFAGRAVSIEQPEDLLLNAPDLVGGVRLATGAARVLGRAGRAGATNYAESAVRGGLNLDPGMEGVMRPARPAGLMPIEGVEIGGGARRAGEKAAPEQAVPLYRGTTEGRAATPNQGVYEGSGFTPDKARAQEFADRAARDAGIAGEEGAAGKVIETTGKRSEFDVHNVPVRGAESEEWYRKPTGVVRTSKGESLPATPENVQEAVTRALSRKTPPQILGADAPDVGTITVALRGGATLDPKDFVDDVARAISKSRTFGGKSLLDGVPLEQVKEALAKTEGLEIVPGRSTNGAGVVRVRIKPENTGALSKAIKEAEAAPPGPPDKPPTRLRGGEPPVEPPPPPSYSWMPKGDEPRPTIGGTKLQQPEAAAKVEGFDWGPGTPLWRKTVEAGKEAAIFITGRTLQAGLDLSYPLRQAGTQIRRAQFWTALDDMGKALVSNKYAVEHEARMRSLEFVPDNLHISPVTGGKFSAREENLASKIGEKLPLYRQTQQAVVTFINDLRANTVNDFGRNLARKYDDTGDFAREGIGILNSEDTKTLEAFANYINRATGRGNLGPLEDSIGLLNQVFYSARRNVAMIQAPMNMFNKSGAVRKEAMMDFVSFVGVGAATLKLADLAGADVSMNPTDADFGKIQVGDTRVDIWGGYQPLARAVYNTYDGQKQDASAKDFLNGWLEFGRNKLAPPVALGVDVAKGENAIGREVKANKEEAIRRMAPLAWQGMIEAIKEDGARGGALAATGLFGTGVQSYVKPAEHTARLIESDLKEGKLPATYLDANRKEQPVKTLDDIKAVSPLAAEEFAKRHPDNTELRKENARPETKRINEIKEKAFESQEGIAPLLKEKPSEWRRQSSEIAGEASEAIRERAQDYDDEREPRTLRDLTNKEYSEAIDAATKHSIVDWAEVDKFVAGLDADQQRILFEGRLAGQPEVRRQYLTDLKEMVPYFEQRDKAWTEFSADDPDLKGYKSFDAFRDSMVKEIHEDGLGWAEARNKVDAKLEKFSTAISKVANEYLIDNADTLLPLLNKYDFHIPAKFQKYVRKAD